MIRSSLAASYRLLAIDYLEFAVRFLVQGIKIGAIVVLTALVLVGARAGYTYATDRGVKPSSDLVMFTISSNEGTDDVATDLKAKGLITSTEYFRLYMLVSRSGDKVRAGTYLLPKGISTGQIINRISGVVPAAAAPAPSVNVFFKEGTRLEEIPAILKDKGMNKASAEFLNTAKTGTFTYDFLKERPQGQTSLEGFLFPDTYRFSVDDDANTVIIAMLDNFGKKLQQARETLPTEARTKTPDGARNLYGVLIIASIVEREAAADSDRPDIASVYYNRLRQTLPNAPPFLQSDPTVQYAVGADGNWWRPITPTDIDSSAANPYNTYKNKGLPPGPICSPSLKSMIAAFAPSNTQYLYFVAKDDSSGTHAFAKTNDEQNANIAKYSSNQKPMNTPASAPAAMPAAPTATKPR